MYGLIGRFTSIPGKRDELIAILSESVLDMPGCVSYVIARDPVDLDVIWITEVWENAEAHRASLKLPAVRQSIEAGKPLIASFGMHQSIEPVGGHCGGQRIGS